MIGRYKLLQQIGEGGMGVVYMAEQEKPVRRRVALKIIKPGMDSQQVIARFEAERQALAMMDHPNIARVLDAGCTDTGRPYFVMELVQGIPITKYCDDKQLDTHARLDLFVQVCQAVQHAHQKGIIHRDLKPSNVLVAIYDAKPVPKIIDFGVAKALHQRLTEKTMFTQFGAVVGTLEYMSPEQADMDLMGTDTRSDIYSLGVLLYELLTGSTPLDGKHLRSLGYAEMLKTIREVDPPKPSTRLSQSINEAASISAKRQTEPRRLHKLIAGDLDWIVMKCLEKDRTRRYETANGLASDIQRHIQDEAVTASPPGQLYKLQKLVRRNKLTFAAIAAITLSLVIGLAAALWQANRAQREAARAASETTLARAAEQQALTTLDELRATAPTFLAQAQALAANAQFDQAIAKLEYAAKLQPDNPEHLVAIGDLYLCQLKLPEAASYYGDALRLKPAFAPAQAKAQLCDQVLAAPRTAQKELNLESLLKIYAALKPQKLSDKQLKAIEDAYSDEKERPWKDWLPRLKSLPMFANINLDPNSGGGGRFEVRDDGKLKLYLGQMDPGDLSQLKSLPISDLYLGNSLNVSDVQPLADIPTLENLTVPPFARNIEALRNLPNLKRLSFSVTQNQSDVDVQNLLLSSMVVTQQGQQINFSPNPNTRRKVLFDIDGPMTRATPATTVEEFWKQYSTLSWLGRLRDSGFKPNKLWQRDAEGYPRTWGIDLTGMGISDLSFLKGLPLSAIWLTDNPVVDLSPLRGMPLANLYIERTKVSDLTPLKGMQLDELWMDQTPVADLSPLRGMQHLSILKLVDCNNITDLSPILGDKELHWLLLPPHPNDIHILRAISTLELIGFGNNTMPPADFWKRYDPDEWQSALRKAGIKPGEIFRRDDGTLTVSFDNKKEFTDLTVLQGMPISILSFDGTSVTDLSPLRGMPLSILSLGNTSVTDLSPLRGMPLTELSLYTTQVKDISPLNGMQIKRLRLNGTLVSDLTPLRGMPLTDLELQSCKQVTDLSPLADAKELANLVLPPNAKEIEFLHTLPRLQRISFREDPNNGWLPDMTADQFWASVKAAQGEPFLVALRKANITPAAHRLGDGSWELTLDHQSISDLSMLKGAQISRLSIASTPVTDLSPLRGMKLTYLRMSGSKVTDLSPIQGMPITNVTMSQTDVRDLTPLIGMPLRDLNMPNCKQITDLSPLQDITTLQNIVLPPNAKNIEILRKLPNVKQIGFTSDTRKPPDQFWADYDRKQSSAATQPVAAVSRVP